jgi:hypothetical protein
MEPNTAGKYLSELEKTRTLDAHVSATLAFEPAMKQMRDSASAHEHRTDDDHEADDDAQDEQDGGGTTKATMRDDFQHDDAGQQQGRQPMRR